MKRRDDINILIKRAREDQDLNQSDIGAACSISGTAVGYWEHKKPEKRTQPSDDQIRLVAKLTHKPLSYFFVDEEGETAAGWNPGEMDMLQPADNQLLEWIDVFKDKSYYERQKILNMAKRLPKGR